MKRCILVQGSDINRNANELDVGEDEVRSIKDNS